MAYNQGDLILDDHYNKFATGNIDGSANHSVNNVNSILADGIDDKGYGQTNSLPSIAPGVEVSATQWATMLNAINLLGSHQSSNITAISNPITGDVIATYNNLQTNIDTINTRRLNAAAVGQTITLDTTRTASWQHKITMIQSVSFASRDHARYFFNAGGTISVQFSRAYGSSNSKNVAWSALCNASGLIVLSSDSQWKTIAGTDYQGTTKIGGSGSPNVIAGNLGYHQLVSSYQTVFRQFGGSGTYSTYSSNYIEVEMAANAGVITIITSYNDVDTTVAVDGTLKTSLTVNAPSTTHLSNVWGTPTLSGSQSGT